LTVDSQEIIRIVATRCQLLVQKRTKFDFGWGSSLNPAGVALELGTTTDWQDSTDTVNKHKSSGLARRPKRNVCRRDITVLENRYQ